MGNRALFIPHYHASLQTTLLPLALSARLNYNIEPVMIIRYADHHESIELLRSHNIVYEIVGSEESVGHSRPGAYPVKSSQYLNPFFFLRKCLEHWEHINQDIERRYAIARQLLDRYKPIAIFEVSESLYLEAFVNAIAQEEHIPTVLVQWALTFPRRYYDQLDKIARHRRWAAKYRSWFYPALELYSFFYGRFISAFLKRHGIRNPRFMGDGNAQHFAVMSEYHAHLFEAQGISKKKLALTGHPEHDILFNYAKRFQASHLRWPVYEKLGLNKEKKVILYVREAINAFDLLSQEEDYEILRSVLHELCSIEDADVVLKIHPRDDLDYYDFIGIEFPNVRIIHRCDLYELIAVSDIFLSQGSSTTLWALALGVPIILLGFAELELTNIFSQILGVIPISEKGKLPEQIRAFLSNKEHRIPAQTRGEFLKLDGKATDRILRIAGIHSLS